MTFTNLVPRDIYFEVSVVLFRSFLVSFHKKCTCVIVFIMTALYVSCIKRHLECRITLFYNCGIVANKNIKKYLHRSHYNMQYSLNFLFKIDYNANCSNKIRTYSRPHWRDVFFSSFSVTTWSLRTESKYNFVKFSLYILFC